MEKQTVKSKLALGPLTVLQGAPVSSILHAGACLKPPLLPLCMGSLALLFGPLRLDTLSPSYKHSSHNANPSAPVTLPPFFLTSSGFQNNLPKTFAKFKCSSWTWFTEKMKPAHRNPPDIWPKAAVNFHPVCTKLHVPEPMIGELDRQTSFINTQDTFNVWCKVWQQSKKSTVGIGKSHYGWVRALSEHTWVQIKQTEWETRAVINLCPGSTVTLMSGEQTAARMERRDSRCRIGLAWWGGGSGWFLVGFVCESLAASLTEYDPLTSFKSQTLHCVIQTLACAFIALIKDITQTHSKPVSRLLSSSSDGTNFESFGVWNFRVSLRPSAALQNRKWGRLDVCQSSWQKKATLPKDLPSVHCEG